MSAYRRSIRLGPLLLGVLLLGGCGRGGGVAKSELPSDQQHILKVASLCAQYKRENRAKLPTSIDELKAFAKKLSKEKQKQYGVDDVEKMFISPRDNQPYGINNTGSEHAGMTKILVYEQVGVNGKRMTASSLGTAQEVDEDEFRRWVK